MNNLNRHHERKQTPVFSGVIKYFPDAISDIARCSHVGNEQHNPGSALHWDRSKSGDELDALSRHLIDAGTFDSDGVRHSTKVAWRALANLQKELEQAEGNTDRNYVVTYGTGNNINTGDYDYCFFNNLDDAEKFHKQLLEDGALTADISEVLTSTD